MTEQDFALAGRQISEMAALPELLTAEHVDRKMWHPSMETGVRPLSDQLGDNRAALPRVLADLYGPHMTAELQERAGSAIADVASGRRGQAARVWQTRWRGPRAGRGPASRNCG